VASDQTYEQGAMEYRPGKKGGAYNALRKETEERGSRVCGSEETGGEDRQKKKKRVRPS